MKYLMVVTVDTNDGDYVTEMTEIAYEDRLFYKRLFTRLGKCKVEYDRDMEPETMYCDELTPEEIDRIDSVCPGFEGGFHSIENIKFYPLAGPEERVQVMKRWNNQW